MSTIDESHEAVVIANQDPDQLGRIRVACQALLDGEDEDMPMWVKPFPQWGWFVIPDVGETVEIVAVVGATDDEQPGTASIANMNLRWRGQRGWGKTDSPEPRPIPDDLLTNYGKRRGFATPAGHIIWFDDTEGEEAITLKWTNKKKDVSTLSMAPDGSVVITNKTGAIMALNATDGTAILVDENGNGVTANSKLHKMSVVDENGNSIVMEAGALTITGASGITLTGPGDIAITAATPANVTVAADKVVVDVGVSGVIELGGHTHSVALGDVLTTYLNGHTHTCAGAGSPGSPPISPASGIASTVVKLK